MFDNSLSYRYYQDDQRISYKEVTKLMAKDSVTNLHWNRARTKNTLVNVMMVASSSLLPVALISENINASIFFGSYFGLTIGSLIMIVSRQKSRSRAILRYNSFFDPPEEQNKVPSSIQLRPAVIISPNNILSKGVSIQLKF